MAQFKGLKLWTATIASLLLVNSVGIHWSDGVSGLSVSTPTALAKSSGGRAGGGSFKSSPPRSSSSSSSSSSKPSKSNSSTTSQPSRPYNSNDRPYNSSSGTVIVPVPVGQPGYNNSYNNSNNLSNQNRSGSASSQDDGSGFVAFLIFLLILGGIGALVWWVVKKNSQGGTTELENDTVTVTKLQVALLAEARAIQGELSDLTLETDTDTPEGLQTLLQESALALLRTPENWTHASVSSKTVKTRDEAEALFNQLSIAERSKFSAETLVNVGGKTRKRQVQIDPDEGTAAYIVVTLLLGTANDKPLFEDKIHSTQELKTALEKVAGIQPEYLMVFELLWSPQDESDSLTYDELLTEYTDMTQI